MRNAKIRNVPGSFRISFRTGFTFHLPPIKRKCESPGLARNISEIRNLSRDFAFRFSMRKTKSFRILGPPFWDKSKTFYRWKAALLLEIGSRSCYPIMYPRTSNLEPQHVNNHKNIADLLFSLIRGLIISSSYIVLITNLSDDRHQALDTRHGENIVSFSVDLWWDLRTAVSDINWSSD
jgi:hypothetical protein